MLLRKLVANKDGKMFVVAAELPPSLLGSEMRVMHPLLQDEVNLGCLLFTFACRGKHKRLRIYNLIVKDE